tara:strand:- start:84 stop:857 length:774 start_codon:yes stop_codon:yes gene_type:complete
MKNLKLKLVSLVIKIPFNQNFLKFIQKIIGFHQGRGWEFNTIKTEINSCISLIKKEPKIFIDIGANKGLYTKEILFKFPQLECHIFEPAEQNYKILKKEINHSKSKINKIALSSSSGKEIIYSDYPGSGLASLAQRRLNHHNINFDHKEEVSTMRFDEYWSNNEQIIDYIKIDVEGFELDVLNGFGKLIQNIKLIQFEFGGANIDTRTYFQDFWYFFQDNNFSLFRINPRGVTKISNYSEDIECFLTTNFIALNNNL